MTKGYAGRNPLLGLVEGSPEGRTERLGRTRRQARREQDEGADSPEAA